MKYQTVIGYTNVRSTCRSGLIERRDAPERRRPVGFEINVNSRHPVMRVVRRFTESRESQGEKLELNPETLDQARLLLNASITEPDGNGVYSHVFKMNSEEYSITFFRDAMVMLSPSIAKPSYDIQFIFKCNAISFHPRGTPQWYALCFHEVHGKLKTPKLLIAGDNECARRLLLYSLPPVEIDGELEFPNQL